MSGADRILLFCSELGYDKWAAAFANCAPTRRVIGKPEPADDPTIRYAAVWKPRPGVLRQLPNLELIFSLGAGVDHIFDDPELPDVPIVRVVAPDLTARMSQHIVWRVMDHLKFGADYRRQQAQKLWHELPQPVAADITVGIMGLGVLGTDAAKKLQAIGFQTAGWSRSAKQYPGISCHAGEAGLRPFLVESDIVVVLLPLTTETEGLIDHKLLAGMKRQTPLGGPVLINVGRGGLQVEQDILQALDAGTLAAASLDVFEQEPLGPENPLWSHGRVFVTPHIAAASDPQVLVPVMVAQMADWEAGRRLDNLVDRAAGY